MIYFDNSATTLMKPEGVAKAVSFAISHYGNAGRSFHEAMLDAGRAVYLARAEVAKLIGLDNPLHIAFTSSATESLNLVIESLIRKHDAVITTVLEHNSVLRPLYRTGCDLSFINCDDKGYLDLSNLSDLLKPNTKCLIATHGSNVTGVVTDWEPLKAFCQDHGLIFILDASQTMGNTLVSSDMADVICFTGHKGLFGPQGTGGIIAGDDLGFSVVKTGGTGINTFDHSQGTVMPDVFEAGTPNSHGLAGLRKGVEFINEIGIAKIREKEMALVGQFCEGLKDLPNLRFYGDPTSPRNLAVVSLNIAGKNSQEIATALWEGYEIATRPGGHCAPLLHQRFGTMEQGILRFSFSYFNTEEEIKVGIQALSAIAQEAEV